jgi:hypothetical protein
MTEILSGCPNSGTILKTRLTVCSSISKPENTALQPFERNEQFLNRFNGSTNADSAFLFRRLSLTQKKYRVSDFAEVAAHADVAALPHLQTASPQILWRTVVNSVNC